VMDERGITGYALWMVYCGVCCVPLLSF
jgi:hypothetical protein